MWWHAVTCLSGQCAERTRKGTSGGRSANCAITLKRRWKAILVRRKVEAHRVDVMTQKIRGTSVTEVWRTI